MPVPPAFDPRVLAVLEALSPGERMWVRGIGRSMYPVLRSGDAILLERCGASPLRRGEWACIKTASGGIAVHVVAGTAPVVHTESWMGVPDPPPILPLARAIRIRRGRVTVPLPRLVLVTSEVLRYAALHLRESPRGLAAVRRARRLLWGPATASLRRGLLEPFVVRTLTAADEEPLLLFAGDHLAAPADFLRERLRTRWQTVGAAAAAFDRRHRMRAFAFCDALESEGIPMPGFWIRLLMVAPEARGLGVGSQVVARLVSTMFERGVKEVFADVREENVASRRLFERLGFTRALEAEPALNQAWRRRGLAASLVAYVKRP